MQWRIVLTKVFSIYKIWSNDGANFLKNALRKMLTIIWNKVKSLVTRNIWYGIENIWS